jgi:protein-glutamine gamma-glutamyltransferase
MIKIRYDTIDPAELAQQYPSGSIEKDVIDILSSSSKIYTYDSRHQLEIELKLRKNIVTAARELYRSGMSFRIFRNSICNPAYWERTDEGGFLLRENVKPTDAVRDIFINGRKYGTECATAIVIIFYKAVLEAFPEERFNELFKRIYLMDWQRDKELGIRYYENLTDYLPGDCRYFKNPDVDPLTPEWQGENAIDLSQGRYYGHGIGIKTAKGIIDALNMHREPGSQTSAYLLDSATRPDFKYLASVLAPRAP